MRTDRSLWLGWVLVCCGILGAVWSIVHGAPQLRQALREPVILGLDEHLTNIEPKQISWLRESAGGRWGRYGWYLAPHEQGSLRIQLPFSKVGILKLRFWAYSAGSLIVRVEEGTRVHQISTEELDSRQIRIPIQGPTELTLSASNQISEEQLILDRFSATWSEEDDRLPSYMPLALGIAVMLAGVLVLRPRGVTVGWREWVAVAAILGATLVGAEERWQFLDMARGHPVDSDVVSYMAYARSFDWFTTGHGFYSGSFGEREPLHVAGLNVWFQLWGDTFPAARLYTVTQSVLFIAACGVFVWQVSGKWFLGAAASWVLALNQVVVEESVRGLRTESMTLLLLVAISLWLRARGWRGAVLLGTAIGSMALLQSPAITIVSGLLGVGWAVNVWRERYGYEVLPPSQWKLAHVVFVGVVAVALYIPHTYGLYTVYGDPAKPSNGYARWNANFEFPERIGTQGFPTAAEFAANPYAGPRLTYGEYLFGLHSIPALLKGQIVGWIESTSYMSTSVTPHVKEYIFLFHASGMSAVLRHITGVVIVVFALSLSLTVIGWLDLWRWPQLWWVPFLSLWGTWYAAFLYSVRLVEPFRHTGHVYPVLILCLLWGSYRVVQWMHTWVSAMGTRL